MPNLPLARSFALFIQFVCLAALNSAPTEMVDALKRQAASDFPHLESLYKHLHAHPELSLHEVKTAARIATELKSAGAETTTGIGGNGVVAVLRNGPGPTVLVRGDLDGLPVKEETGLPYASRATGPGHGDTLTPVMHACGHDVHSTVLVGTARALQALKPFWTGTVVLIAQPAEERGLGARAMLTAGLYRDFPRPDYAIALHVSATLPAGDVGTIEGPAMANVDKLDILVRGIGGHGAYPHTTKDPIVLASRIVVALQTIVSRETRPTEPAVVTVGSIHGGTKHNIIPDSVKLELTLRSYSDEVRTNTLAAVARICRGEAIAAGMPEELWPIVTPVEVPTPSVHNDPALTRRIRSSLLRVLGPDRVHQIEPEMAGEDFSHYGRTQERIPICLFRLGVVSPESLRRSQETGQSLPSLHSNKFAPAPSPSIENGVVAMAAAVMDLLRTPASKADP